MRWLWIVAVVLASALPCWSQQLGARDQWQPQTERDPRLGQRVEIEILGRAAVPALAMLSQATGVALGVAPEDASTVAERKVSLFAHGCALKDIMVQLAGALQECHWDVDPSDAQPTYCLHRNGSAENTMSWLKEREAARKTGEKRAERLGRLEDARRALKMSPEELAELEKTDPLMARSARDVHARDLLEIILSLPSDQMAEFQDTGSLAISYVQAPERLQKAMQRIAEWYVVRVAGERLPEEVVHWRDHLAHATISFDDTGVEHGWGVWLSLDLPAQAAGGAPRIHDVALMPRHCNLDEGQFCYTRLLVATGVPDEQTAFQMTMDMDHGGFRADAARREERHKREWVEPTDPDLLQTVALGDAKFTEFADIQRFIAQKTGLSIISDYFTGRSVYVTDEARAGLPLWRLLYLLGEEDFGAGTDVYLWQKAGKCLTFHRADWYALVSQELPESLILTCREKIARQGRLTLDDLAQLAASTRDRPVQFDSFPEDLMRAGASNLLVDKIGLLFYGSMSAEQIGRARGPEGLRYDEMTISQRERIVQIGQTLRPANPRGEVAKAVLHIEDTATSRGAARLEQTHFRVRFPSGEWEDTVSWVIRAQTEKPPAGGS